MDTEAVDSRTEEFRDIPKYKGLYKVSNTGKVLSLRFNKIMSLWKNNKGYLCLYLYKKGERTKYRVHYLVCKVFKGYCRANRNEVNHIDHNKQNNNDYNVEWDTRSGNMKKMYKHKRQNEKKKTIEVGSGPF